MMTYPLVYMLIWTIPTTIRIYQATTGNSAPFAIGTVDKVSQHLPPALSNPSSSPILTILSSPRSNTWGGFGCLRSHSNNLTMPSTAVARDERKSDGRMLG